MPFSGEEAATRLASLANADWEAEQRDRIAELPRRLRRPAERMFGSANSSKSRLAGQELTEWLDLSSKQRQRIFEAAAPGRGRLLDGAWEIHDRLPYQTGWVRRSFRAPGPGRVVALPQGLSHPLGHAHACHVLR